MEYQKQKENPFEVLVYESLKKKIMSGEYLAGDKISEQTVSDELGVSRSPLRSAIRRLTSEGLIEYYPYRGAFVKVFTDKDIRDCFEMRILLESYAIQNIRKDKLEEAREDILQLIDRCSKAVGHEERSQVDVLVHETAIMLCDNETLLHFYRMLYTKIGLFREISVYDVRMEELSNRSHMSLLKAILSGNTDKALHVMRKHLTESEEKVLAYYQSRQKKA